MRCRACARLLERLSVARRCSALRSALCRLAQPGCTLVSAFPSYLLFPARDVVEEAYDVLFSRLLFLVSLHAASLARVCTESELLKQLGLRAIH